MTRIVGIVLVRNEDLYVARAVKNALAFCDSIVLADQGSTDRTVEVLRELVASHPEKLSLHQISHPRESHDLVKPLAGTATWVFAVDGDEIYDPAALAAFRPRLLGGEFDRHWMVLGNVLHCASLGSAEASGYLAPPSRSITKLYNFAAIDAWDGDTVERLHGGDVRFRTGYGHTGKRNLQDEYPWDESPLRCLHLCFLRRSSAEPESSSVRENIMELYRGSITDSLRRWFNRLLGRQTNSSWKREFYRRGPVVTAATAPFFPPDA